MVPPFSIMNKTLLFFILIICCFETKAQNNKNYASPPTVNDLYYKHKSGVAVKLRIWKKQNSSSGDTRINNYLNSLYKSTYGEDSGWGFELSPGWMVYKGTKLQITNNYFELKQVQGGITTIIKVARDLSWVSGYDSMSGREVLFDRNASKQEYDAWCEAHKNFQYGGTGNYSSSGTTNSGTSSTSQGSRCKGCNGTGHCTMCKGKGWYKNTYDSNAYDCPSCHASGRCGVCYGKGYIR